MSRIRALRRALSDERGQDTVEFGLLAAFVAILSLLTLKSIGPLVRAIYSKLMAALALNGR